MREGRVHEGLGTAVSRGGCRDRQLCRAGQLAGHSGGGGPPVAELPRLRDRFRRAAGERRCAAQAGGAPWPLITVDAFCSIERIAYQGNRPECSVISPRPMANAPDCCLRMVSHVTRGYPGRRCERTGQHAWFDDYAYCCEAGLMRRERCGCGASRWVPTR